MLRHALVLVLATTFVLASLLAGCTGSGSANPSAPGATAPPTAPPVTAAPVPSSLPAGTVRVEIGGETNGVTVCAGSVWVAYYLGGDYIAQVDPATGTVLGLVEGGLNLACLDGEPWVAAGKAIQHIDATTREVLASVALQNAYYIGVGDGSIWTASLFDVVRIDPATATIVTKIRVNLGEGVTEIDGTDDAIWATVKTADKVIRIDPATNTVVKEIAAGSFAHGILIQPDAIWISNGHQASVDRIDPVTNKRTIITGPGSGVGLAEGAGFIWSSTREGDLYRIDPATSEPTLVGHIDGWPYGIGFLDGTLWVTDGVTAIYGIPVAALLP